MKVHEASVAVAVCVLTMLAGPLGATSATPVGSRVERRADLADLHEALRLVASLYPELNPKARVIATLGSLDGQLATPLIDLTLEEEGGVLSKNLQGEIVPTPRRKIYGGVVRFDARRRLHAYSGRTTTGDERFQRLVARLASASQSHEAILAALREAGARFVDRGPARESCPSLAIVSRALGGVVGEQLGEGPFATPLDLDEMKDVVRNRLVWNVQLTVKRDGTTKRLGVAVDPWGDVLSVGTYGEAWP